MCFILWIRDFIKYFWKMIVYYFFLLFQYFWHFFSISRIQACQNIMEFFVVFYSKDQRFYQRILEIFKIPRFTICFFIFLLFLTFSVPYRLSVLVKKFWKFLCFFILWIRDFIKDFWKIMERFSKKIHLKSKICHKFHYLLFVYFFIFSAFLTSFFPISPNQTCQKILNNFVVLCYTDYRFQQRILENS